MDPLLQLMKLVPTSSTTPGLGASELVVKATETSGNLMDYLTQSNIFVAAGAIYVFPTVLKRIPGIKKVMNSQWVVRFMPLYPVVAAMLIMFLPGAVQLPDQQIGTIFIAGIWTAFWAMFGHKLLGQTLMGDDRRITTMAVVTPGQDMGQPEEEESLPVEPADPGENEE